MWQRVSPSSTGAKSTVYIHDQDIVEVAQGELEMLKRAVKSDPLGRARLCLHRGSSDTVQQMIIAFGKGSYVRPHRHRDKSESFHVIEGELSVVFFDEYGGITHDIILAPLGNGRPFVYRSNESSWHTVVPLTEFVIIHEIAAGPFEQEGGEFPEWAAEETDADGIRKFLANHEQYLNSEKISFSGTSRATI